MYLLIDGEVIVEKGGVELGYLSQQGAFFGETPVLDPKGSRLARTRTVRAVTDCFMVYLRRSDVEDIANLYPELRVRLKLFAKTGGRALVREVSDKQIGAQRPRAELPADDSVIRLQEEVMALKGA